MQLINNEAGTWEQSKTFLTQDFATIQKNINAILAQINALEAPTPDPPAVIAPSNQVTIPSGVFTAHQGALLGNGLVTTPLAVNVDGTTITVNTKNQLTGGGVVVDAAGGLTGAGTAGSPLAVNVDGATITINGSNQLVAAATQVVFSVTISVGSLGGGVQVLLLSHVTGKIIWPVAIRSTVVSAANSAFSASSVLVYGGTGTAAISGSFPLVFAVGAGAGTWDGMAAGLQTVSPVQRGVVDNGFEADVYIKSWGATGAGGGNSATLTMYYLLL